MNDAINLVNAGHIPTVEAVQVYQDARREMFKIRAELLRIESNNLAKATGIDATKQLAKINTFITFTIPASDIKMNDALLNPDPTRIIQTRAINFED